MDLDSPVCMQKKIHLTHLLTTIYIFSNLGFYVIPQLIKP